MSEPQQTDRREFFKKTATLAISSALGLAPLLAGWVTLFDPLRRHRRNHPPFLPVAPREALPADGRPQIFKIFDDRVDAWTRLPREAVGNVYLRQVGNTVRAWNATCPHLGCLIETTADGSFLCPCHNSKFTADGRIDASRGGIVPSPRDMDALEARVETVNGVEMVTVKFQNFVLGRPEKIPAA